MQIKLGLHHAIRTILQHSKFNGQSLGTLQRTLRRILCRYAYTTSWLFWRTCGCTTLPWSTRPRRCLGDLPGRRALRSAGSNRLVMSPFRLITVGSRAFRVAAADQLAWRRHSGWFAVDLSASTRILTVSAALSRCCFVPVAQLSYCDTFRWS